MTMSEFSNAKSEKIDYWNIPGYNVERTNLGVVFSLYGDQMKGKILSIHHSRGAKEEDSTFAGPVHWAGLLENGNIGVLSEDFAGRHIMHSLDGSSTK